jgi:hypothetical protein
VKDDNSHDDSRPWLTVAGDIEACASSLERLWKRRVTVPEGMMGRKLRKRTVTGTREEMAKALGLALGPKRRHSGRTEMRVEVRAQAGAGTRVQPQVIDFSATVLAEVP